MVSWVEAGCDAVMESAVLVAESWKSAGITGVVWTI